MAISKKQKEEFEETIGDLFNKDEVELNYQQLSNLFIDVINEGGDKDLEIKIINSVKEMLNDYEDQTVDINRKHKMYRKLISNIVDQGYYDEVALWIDEIIQKGNYENRSFLIQSLRWGIKDNINEIYEPEKYKKVIGDLIDIMDKEGISEADKEFFSEQDLLEEFDELKSELGPNGSWWD